VKFRAVGNLANTDVVMNDTFWIGVYPGLGLSQIEYMVEQFGEFIHAASAQAGADHPHGRTHAVPQGRAH